MSKRREDLPDEVKDAVVRDYQAGAKAMVIQWEYKIGPGTMYRILQAKQIKLRTSATGRRPRTGEWRLCKGCGKEIYVQRHRIDKGKGNHCRKCANKTFLLPNRVEKAVVELEIPFVVRVRELVTRSENMLWSDTLDELDGILVACLKGDPVGTITILFPGRDPFTVEMVLRATVEYYITQILRTMPSFEYLGDGMWKLKKEAK